MIRGRSRPTPKSAAAFHDFEQYERLVEASRSDPQAHLVVLLGGEAGLRCGEIMALEWANVDLQKRQLCVKIPFVQVSTSVAPCVHRDVPRFAAHTSQHASIGAMTSFRSLSDAQFQALFRDFRVSAFRLETLQRYAVAYEDEPFRDFLAVHRATPILLRPSGRTSSEQTRAAASRCRGCIS